MTGSPTFRISPSDKFTRSYKELRKRYYKGDKAKQTFQDWITQIVTNLSTNPQMPGTFLESWPRGMGQPEEWEFRKLYFDMPNLRGASGEGRLMYLVNRNQNLIKLVWIYTHEEFEKRPPDKNLKQLLQELVESLSEERSESSSNDESQEEENS